MNIGKLVATGMLALSCAGWGVQAQDLFVDQNHPEARDDNPGTEVKPFRWASTPAARFTAPNGFWSGPSTAYRSNPS